MRALRWRSRLLLVVALVALSAVSVTAWLSVQVTTPRVQRMLSEGAVERGGMGPRTAGADAPGSTMAAERHATLQRDLWWANLQAAGIALLVAAAAGVLLAEGLVRPLRALTRVATRWERGERDTRASERGRDEVAELARGFNRLVDRLQAEESQQRRLLADIAHELRTPLTVLKGELEAWEDGLLPRDGDTLRRLGEELALLERLVADLGLLTRAESGALSLDPAPLALDALATEVVDGFRPQAAARSVTLRTEVEPARVVGDPLRLRQVVGNLLDNGIRHAPAGTEVVVAVRAEGDGVALAVRDHGPGIPDAERERVFERFYRVDRARTRSAGGSGLGLAIVRSLVALHGGRVHADTHPEGGAVLRVWLPGAQRASRRPAVRAAEDDERSAGPPGTMGDRGRTG